MSNIAKRIREQARLLPRKEAIILCRGPGKSGRFFSKSHSFADLERGSDMTAHALFKSGIKRGMKTLLMLSPSFAFYSYFFALLKIGAPPVLIDPGMGIRRLLECVRRLAPEAMVGMPKAHMARILFPGSFPGLKKAVVVGPDWLGGRDRKRARDVSIEPFPIAEPEAGELAAILFTTGSTGPAKGVEYSHAALDGQVEILSRLLSVAPEDRDAATFPGFSLFSVALGMTAVVPDLNPIQPGQAHPPNIIAAIQNFKCTLSFGSPALWDRVSRHAEAEGISLPSLRLVIMAGAPIPVDLHRRLLGGILPPGAETLTPYGATEAMPVACFGGGEVLAETAELTKAGKGVCIGRPAPGARVEIIGVHDNPIPFWSEDFRLPDGEIGEIVVQAEHASRSYHRAPEADALAKIADRDGFWHRMGDVGYRDGQGRFWFCGRKSHRVVTPEGVLFSICCEAVFNRHPEVMRSALIGLPADGGFSRPAVIVETRSENGIAENRRLANELFRLGRANPLTANIGMIFFHREFPTDIRHNAKIRREELAAWADARPAAAFLPEEPLQADAAGAAGNG